MLVVNGDAITHDMIGMLDRFKTMAMCINPRK